jgi:large subunit ribosomal protein L7/L12
MAKLKAKDIIEALKEMTILEINEVVDLMKEEFGVDPSAVAVAAPAAAAAEEGPSSVTIVLKEVGPSKIPVIKQIQAATGLGLKDAKDIADNCGVIKENVPTEEAETIKAAFVELGATIEFK